MRDMPLDAKTLADLRLAEIMGFTTPRRPKKWGKVIEQYLKLDCSDKEQLTKERVQGLIDWFAPGAKKKRTAKEKEKNQKRREGKDKAREVRNLPENKNQEWSYSANQNWSFTGDVDDEGNDEIRVHVKKPRTFTAYQYDPYKELRRLLDIFNKGESDQFLSVLAKERNRDLNSIRLQTSNGVMEYEGQGPGHIAANDNSNEPLSQQLTGNPAFPAECVGNIDNNPELSSGFQHGSGTVPGKKLSGNDRKKLGERDDKELDREALVGSHNLGSDTDGRTVEEMMEVFGATWKESLRRERAKEREERKEWRATIG